MDNFSGTEVLMSVPVRGHRTYDRLGNPVELTAEMIGGKWKGKIICILLSGTKRFGELRRLVGTATQRVLTFQLRELEKDGIVQRKVFVEGPLKVEYSLTQRGQDLKPVIEAMWLWGQGVQASLNGRFQEDASTLAGICTVATTSPKRFDLP